ncbi:MAG: coproporphyrinogen dehydrogenase HemZ [Epulopiscium sp. Nele67-Bin005]|nr:MAG: coproporphyrinogen dehydrogenase HemZ [Epulopiscium sp. Nele67-Bin005]
MIVTQQANYPKTYEIEHLVKLFIPFINEPHILFLDNDTKKAQLTIGLYRDAILQENLIEQQIISDTTNKVAIKSCIYQILNRYTNKSMPWGVLTGIRPTKLVHQFKNKSYNKEEIHTTLLNNYHISQAKVELLTQVADAEYEILKNNTSNEISIYIGIPFCPTQCIYCSFGSSTIAQKKTVVPNYLVALYKEIKEIAKHIQNKYVVNTIYIGGGTPTSLNEEQFHNLLSIVNENFDIKNVVEFTVEAGRPDTITHQKLIDMKKFGVNRISINPQTMNQDTLNKIGRNHSVEQIQTAFLMAREVGHQIINMDIILGLPNETLADVQNTLEEIVKLQPENITIHTMAIKRASALGNTTNLLQSKNIEQMVNYSQKLMHTNNFSPYYMYRQKNILGNFENVGYSKNNYHSIYNIQIIAEQQTIIGFGAGSVSKIVGGAKIKRIPNVKGIEEYIVRIEEMIQNKMNVI